MVALWCPIATDSSNIVGSRPPVPASDSHDLPAFPLAPGWSLVEEGLELSREPEIEALFTTANGYVGTRGSFAEGYDAALPATFVAGVFDKPSGPGSTPALVVLPDWTRLQVVIEGQALTMDEGEVLEHRRVLDLRYGIVWREWRHRDPTGRVLRLRFLRLASLSNRNLLLQSVSLTPENFTGNVCITSVLAPVDGHEGLLPAVLADLIPAMTIPYQPARGSSHLGPVALVLRTRSTGITVALAAASRLQTGDSGRAHRAVDVRDGQIRERWDWHAEAGKTYRLDRLVVVSTSRETPQPVKKALPLSTRLLTGGADQIIDAHSRAWTARWQAADVEVEGDPAAQRALRFAGYHLISAVNPEDERVSIGARALTGPAYKGHVFWDTEIYMLPFYIFTDPPAARALLMYRYHTLPAAREKAHRLGYRGALYAWESADSGAEATPPVAISPTGEVVRILTGEQEHHISADVAYAVWQYWQVSGDDQFFLDAGAEILLETTRFWASRAQREDDGRYHIRHVIGPDEYHEDVDDNAYTNVMAQWNLEHGAAAARMLKERWPQRWAGLAERLQIAPGEPEAWLQIAAAMYTGLDPESGLFEQFQGYFDLEEIDLADYAGRTVPMDVVLGRERTQRSQVIKQPDVILLLHLLWDRFPPRVREANFRYYEPRCGHGSSLSPAIHALVAARLGDVALAEQYFQQAAAIDLANGAGNTASGVHLATQGGLWQAAVFGFAGLSLRAHGPAFTPHLPQHWQRLRFQLQWRGQRLLVRISPETWTVKA